MNVGILVYEDCTTSMILGVLDILSLASIQYKQEKGKDLFKIELVSERGGIVHSFNGFPIHSQRSIKTKVKYDLIYMPGFLGDLDTLVVRQKKLVSWIKSQYEKGTIVAAACNGNFFLAEAGILDGKKATTHWSMIETFRKRYPKIILQPERIIVDNGSILSAAGVTAYFNLAIFLIERYASKDLAISCAKVFLVDSGRKIQTPYQMFQIPKNHGDEQIAHLQEWLETNFNNTISLDKLASVASLGKKSLARRFKKETGDTPLIYVQKLRVENAKRLLESKNLSFSEITWKVGYNDVSAFHKVFKSETGLTPIEYRSKFSIV